jgi:hypothetical protein
MRSPNLQIRHFNLSAPVAVGSAVTVDRIPKRVPPNSVVGCVYRFVAVIVARQFWRGVWNRKFDCPDVHPRSVNSVTVGESCMRTAALVERDRIRRQPVSIGTVY